MKIADRSGIGSAGAIAGGTKILPDLQTHLNWRWCIDCHTDACEHVKDGRRYLTRQEVNILVALRDGLQTKEIATLTGLTEGSVKVYLSRVYFILGVENRVQAALFAERFLGDQKVQVPRHRRSHMMAKLALLLLFVGTTAFSQSFQLHIDPSELSGTVNGATITPAIGPSGTVIVNGTGAVNFTPVPATPPGTGAYFTNCCASTNNAYFKWTGAQLGNLFTASQGSVTFYLTSRYSFAQRLTFGSSYRFAFDVQDAPGTHELGFYMVAVGGTTPRLELVYYRGLSAASGYYAPIGAEDNLFGAGVTLKVSITWSNGTMTLSLNDAVAQSSRYAAPIFTWGTTSAFTVGAQAGGSYVLDDIIDEFTVTAGSTAGVVPTFSSGTATIFPYNTASTFTVSATGSATLSESGTLPVGVTFDPASGILSGTSTASGAYPLTFVAQNGTGSATQAFNLVIGAAPVTQPPAPVAPVITSSATAAFVATNSGSFTVFATGSPAPALTLSGALPAGLTFDPNSGAIAGAAQLLGAFPVTVTAANSAGTVTQTLTITVTAPAVVTFTCPVVYDSTAQMLSITSCPAGALIPASAFSAFSFQMLMQTGSATWALDGKKFVASFGSTLP